MKKNFIDRINDLKQEVVVSIISILKENNLTELEFPEELEDRTYVVWFDDDGNVYETTVDKISLCEDLTGEGISIDVHDEDSNCSDTLYYHDLGLQNLYWLVNLREDIMDTLGVAHTPDFTEGQKVYWRDPEGLTSGEYTVLDSKAEYNRENRNVSSHMILIGNGSSEAEVHAGELEPMADDEPPKEPFVFIYPVSRFERNVADEDIIADFDNDEEHEFRTQKFTPDEFAEFINDECFSDTCYWVRIISI